MSKSSVFIITGDREQGKTTLLKKVIPLLKEKRIPINGFYAQGYWENNRRSRFELTEVNSGITKPLCEPDSTSGHGFIFNEETVNWGLTLLKPQTAPALYIIDEVGKYEVNGKVWHHALQQLAENKKAFMLITVRKSFIDEVIETFHLSSPRIFDLSHKPEEISQEIEESFNRFSEA